MLTPRRVECHVWDQKTPSFGRQRSGDTPPPPLLRKPRRSSLTTAILSQEPRAVKAVLALEPDAARASFEGKPMQLQVSPLIVASRLPSSPSLLEVLSILLRNGADPCAPDVSGLSAFSVFTMSRCDEMQCAELDPMCRTAGTAVRTLGLKAINKMLAHGADPYQVCSGGQALIDIVRQRGCAQVHDLLSNYRTEQARIVMSRATHSSVSKLGLLRADDMRHIFSFLN
eukprot:gb/GFBE01049522.1/.p1 GENE.gb/GFBE01049522.1/~~gb/GFBE01049522.1/.p1  ORF type:complete len:228 (+),score=29.78 gb/GFBE01049522.1/:1-684(+)